MMIFPSAEGLQDTMAGGREPAPLEGFLGGTE